jgi:hypothetical protein
VQMRRRVGSPLAFPLASPADGSQPPSVNFFSIAE